MWRKVAKVGAVKTERNRSRSERKVGVSCTCGLLVARGPGRGATSRIIPRRKEVAIPLAYPAPEKVRNRNSGWFTVPRARSVGRSSKTPHGVFKRLFIESQKRLPFTV